LIFAIIERRDYYFFSPLRHFATFSSSSYDIFAFDIADIFRYFHAAIDIFDILLSLFTFS
jgi:hypothetical protein